MQVPTTTGLDWKLNYSIEDPKKMHSSGTASASLENNATQTTDKV
jgi:hypothetical protein